MPDGNKQNPPDHLVRYDGKEHPLTADSPPGDVVVHVRIDRFTEQSIYKRNGQLRGTTIRVVSQDGRVMTLTSKFVRSDGKEVETVTVYDKE
jgi:hypothetical protein